MESAVSIQRRQGIMSTRYTKLSINCKSILNTLSDATQGTTMRTLHYTSLIIALNFHKWHKTHDVDFFRALKKKDIKLRHWKEANLPSVQIF